MSALAQTDDGPDFSEELLALYYQRLFPYDHMFKWLSYGNDPKATHAGNLKDFFYRREWSFTLADDIYIRYNCFKDASDMKAAMVKRQPHKIDIGAVFNLPPKDHLGVSAASFKTVERELVFDIDLTDYDDVRTCCSGAKICRKCWAYMTMAIRCLEPALKDDFGFQHVNYIYSGRRGVHAWVSDANARALSNDARSAVVEYLGIDLGESEKAKKAITWPPHPMIKRSYDVLKPLFDEHIASDDGQAIFAGQDRWEKVLATLPVESIVNRLSQKWSRTSDDSTSSEKWAQVEAALLEYTAKPKEAKRAMLNKGFELEKWRLELVLTHCYPRLDENVSKMQNHLLKSPFCVHPKTGRVCVPIDPTEADDFNPMAVPTLRTLMAEINAYDKAHTPEEVESTSDLAKTSMGPYMESFDRNFLNPLYRDLRRGIREEAEIEAAAMGDF